MSTIYTIQVSHSMPYGSSVPSSNWRHHTPHIELDLASAIFTAHGRHSASSVRSGAAVPVPVAIIAADATGAAVAFTL